MSSKSKPIDDVDLHAYVDGELDESRCLDVEAYLAKNPEAAQRVRQYQQLDQELHHRFDPVLNETVPITMLPCGAAGDPGSGFPRFLQAAAVAGMMLVSGLAGWLLQAQTGDDHAALAMADLVKPAAFAHMVYATDSQRPVEIAAENHEMLADWVSERMHTPIRAPLLSGVGFELVGGRLLPSTDRMAAQFMYQNATGERVTLYIRRIASINGHTAFRYHEEDDGVGVFYWIDGPMGYAVSGSLSKNRLIGVAEAVQDSLV